MLHYFSWWSYVFVVSSWLLVDQPACTGSLVCSFWLADPPLPRVALNKNIHCQLDTATGKLTMTFYSNRT